MSEVSEKELVTLTIDGQTVRTAKGTTILQAASSIGINIPYYCFHPGLPIVGSCRMCLVEIEKIPKLQPSCATPVADGMVVRSEHNALVIDLDGDGDEGTGWELLYMHLADYQRAPEGIFLDAGDPIGHPSCEGGPADGTHVHLARKFNGEWIAAGEPLPFVMSGWVAQAGYRPYDGSLVRGNQIVQANPLSPAAAFISRLSEDLRSDLAVSQDLWWEEFGD